MNKISMLILAGGLGSRYKGSKQVDVVSQNQETLMEFGLYDALKAGISKFIFVINSAFPEEHKIRLSKILNAQKAEAHFVVQSATTYIPEEYLKKLKNRQKPLGTGHAVYCAKTIIDEAFITVNADDYYGRKSFEIAVSQIKNQKITKDQYGMIAFKLGHTLSEQGGVSRGICQLKDDDLVHIEEFTSIKKHLQDISGLNSENQTVILNEDAPASMNLWLLHPSFFEMIEVELNKFLKNLNENENSEFYLPSVIDHAIADKKIGLKVSFSDEKWFGLTYREDKEKVIKELDAMKEKGVYPKNLWNLQ